MLKSLFRKFFPAKVTTLSNLQLTVRICVAFFGMNCVGLALANLWSVERPILDVDYLLVPLVYVWLSRSAAAVIAVIVFLLDAISMMIPIFFYGQYALNIFFWLRSLMLWSRSFEAAVILGTLCLFLVTIGLFRRYQLSHSNRVAATAVIAGLIAVLVLADWLNGTGFLIFSLAGKARDFNEKPKLDLVGSPGSTIADVTLRYSVEKPLSFSSLKPDQSATGTYFSCLLAASPTRGELEKGPAHLPLALGQEHLPNKLVVVVVESLSVLKADPGLEGWRSPFKNLGKRYTIQSGILKWHGATLRGELRELCWKSKDGEFIPSLPVALPAVLRKLQYKTCAFHGWRSSMYDRSRLYPSLGFEKSVFLDEMIEENPGRVPLAGAMFHGATDSFVASLVRKEILRSGKRMVYWMTLSGHVPVNMSLAAELATPEDKALAQKLPEKIWAHNVICRNVLRNIASIAAEESLRDCDFVIVGDHSIPIPNATLRSYYLKDTIPYLILRHVEQPEMLKQDSASTAN